MSDTITKQAEAIAGAGSAARDLLEAAQRLATDAKSVSDLAALTLEAVHGTSLSEDYQADVREFDRHKAEAENAIKQLADTQAHLAAREAAVVSRETAADQREQDLMQREEAVAAREAAVSALPAPSPVEAKPDADPQPE